MLLVQLGINSTSDVCKFCQIGRAARGASPIWQNLQTSRDCTRQRMITYTNMFRHDVTCSQPVTTSK